jgi:hypothetical protein
MQMQADFQSQFAKKALIFAHHRAGADVAYTVRSNHWTQITQ